MAEPIFIFGRMERVPDTVRRLCGSSCAHTNCRFADGFDGLFALCGADGAIWSECPYRQSGMFINVFDKGEPK